MLTARSALRSSNLVSADETNSFDDQFSWWSNKNCGPKNQRTKFKWSIEIERVEISEGFDVNGTWHQMSGDVLLRITSTLFWAPTPHRLWAPLIHHNASILSPQQNIHKTLTSFSSVSSTETNYFWQQNTCQKLKT